MCTALDGMNKSNSHLGCVSKASSLEVRAGRLLHQILHRKLSESKFSPRCARLFFFMNPAPARGGPSVFSENWIWPLRQIFVLHTKRLEIVICQNQNVAFAIGFGRPLFSDTAFHCRGGEPSHGNLNSDQ